jgi:hypothetical protein
MTINTEVLRINDTPIKDKPPTSDIQTEDFSFKFLIFATF